MQELGKPLLTYMTSETPGSFHDGIIGGFVDLGMVPLNTCKCYLSIVETQSVSEMRSWCELVRREIEWFALTYSCTKCFRACSKLMARCSQKWWRSRLCCDAGVAKQDIALTLLLLHWVFQRVAISVEPPLNLAPTPSLVWLHLWQTSAARATVTREAIGSALTECHLRLRRPRCWACRVGLQARWTSPVLGEHLMGSRVSLGISYILKIKFNFTRSKIIWAMSLDWISSWVFCILTHLDLQLVLV